MEPVPPSPDAAAPGKGLSNLDYAPWPNAWGVHWASEVVQLQRPDTGNMNCCTGLPIAQQRTQWLEPC